MSALETFIRRLSEVSLSLGSVAVILIAVTITADVMSRYFLGGGFSSTIEIVSFYFMVALAFLPLVALEHYGEQVDTDLFYNRFPEKLKFGCDFLATLLSLCFYALLTWMTWGLALKATARGEVAMGVNLIPIWPARWLLPAGFALAMLAVLWNMVRIMRGQSYRQDSAPKTE